MNDNGIKPSFTRINEDEGVLMPGHNGKSIDVVTGKLIRLGTVFMVLGGLAFVFFAYVFIFGGKAYGQVIDYRRSYGKDHTKYYTVAYRVDGEEYEADIEYIFKKPHLWERKLVCYFPPFPSLVFDPLYLVYSLAFVLLGHWLYRVSKK